MENQLIAAVAVFISGCILIAILAGYAMLWALYPVVSLILTLVLILLGACMLLAKVKKLTDEVRNEEEKAE